MRQTDAEVLSEVEQHLQQAEAQLSIAIAKFGPRCGGYRFMVGSWGDYQKAVGTLLRMRHFMKLVERARQRSERYKDEK
ncbi:hypothetical protein [Paraburkholderia elongata]|uniref:Uncharacterized protein n=1 Tax=Paraburkholderia elongata TaxID=2675747 RepID=A0A972SMM2_9BURK|nr:hypothetical protein [Paraburkholderia elongata]NPT59035.1 hypothetical protein [Paraburkholderia elongata]